MDEVKVVLKIITLQLIVIPFSKGSSIFLCAQPDRSTPAQRRRSRSDSSLTL